MWRESELFRDLREPQTGGACSSCSFYDTCKGGCMAAKFFTGIPLDGPDPECVQGHGETLLAQRPEDRANIPKPSADHSRRTSRKPRPVPVTLSTRRPERPPVSACEENPLAGLRLS